MDQTVQTTRINWTEFQSLQNDWNRLHSLVRADRLFLSWTWIENWWHQFSTINNLQFHGIKLTLPSGEVIGIIPFFLHTARLKGGIPIKRLQLLGNLHAGPITMRSEFNDLLIDPLWEIRAIVQLVNYLDDLPDWSDLIIQDADASSSRIALMGDLMSTKARFRDIGNEKNDRAWYIDTQQSFDDYLGQLTPSVKRRLFDRRRYIEKIGKVRLDYVNANSITEYLERLNDLHEIRWGSPVFEGTRRSFHERLCEQFVTQGEAPFSKLSVNGELISVLYNFKRDGREYNIQQGFNDKRFGNKASPGLLHLGYAIERACTDPSTTRFELLAGCGKHTDYKTSLATDFRSLRTLSFTRSPTLKTAQFILEKIRSIRAKNDSPSPIVVITAAHTINGYNTARAARDIARNIIGIGKTDSTPYANANIWSQFRCLPNYAENLLSELNKITTQFVDAPVVLLPCDDEAVVIVSENRNLLLPHIRFVLPSCKDLAMMMNKEAFYDWADNIGYRVPRSIRASDANQLAQAISQFSPPYVIKPGVRTDNWDRKFPTKKLLLIEDSHPSELELDELFELGSEYVAQEWIPGDDSAVYFCLVYFDQSGELRGRVAGRKLLQWPPINGSTALCTTNFDPYLLSLSTEILSRAGLKGLGSLEFKKHQETGEYFIIEPTVGRNDHQSYIAISGGLNLTSMAIADASSTAPGWRHPHRQGNWIDELATARRLRQQSGYDTYRLSAKLNSRNTRFASLTWFDWGLNLRLAKSWLRHLLK